MPGDVQLTDCDSDKCILNRGESYNLTIDFMAPLDAQDAKLDIEFQIGQVVIPWPDQPTDICNNYVPCPMEAGQSYAYQGVLPIPSSYPAIEGTTIFRLNDGNKNALFCFELDVKLV